MQVNKEFLLEAVGLSLLVGLLLFGVEMFNRATSLMKVFERRQEEQLLIIQEHEITQYENRTVDGVTVVSYMKNMVYHYEIKVMVELGDRSFWVEEKEDCKWLDEEESEYYIPPFLLYECAIIRDENGNVDYILIKAKEGEHNE